jgi:hypothetical protein
MHLSTAECAPLLCCCVVCVLTVKGHSSLAEGTRGDVSGSTAPACIACWCLFIWSRGAAAADWVAGWVLHGGLVGWLLS